MRLSWNRHQAARRRSQPGLAALLAAGALLVPGEGQAQVPYTDAAHVCPWSGRNDAPVGVWGGMLCTHPCAGDMSRIDNCYNADAPPAPSILRPLEVAGLVPESPWGGPYTAGTQPSYWTYEGPVAGEHYTLHPIDLATAAFPHGKKNPGMTDILPFGRSSNDGRLQLYIGDWDQPALSLFRPEALDYDYAIEADPSSATLGISPQGPKVELATLMYQNPLDTGMQFDVFHNAARHGEGIFIHNTLCDDSSPAWAPPGGRTRNPIACKAPATDADEVAGHYQEGDCYQISILFQGAEDWTPTSWELRSTALTIFVPHAKRDGTGLAADAQRPWVYPRQALTPAPPALAVLPSLQRYQGLPWVGTYENNYRTAHGLVGATLTPIQHMFITSDYRSALHSACYATGPHPAWCEFLYNQRHRNAFTLHNFSGTESWTGNASTVGSHPGHSLFEPTVTGDGRLLLLNLAGFGVAYSYNTVGACRADGFENMHHVSEMPWDTEINTRYPIAMNQVGSGPHVCGTGRYFRDTKGRDIHWRTPIPGAYPWIDREGRNIFFAAVNESRDGWRASSQSNVAPGDAYADNARYLNPDVDAGKGTVALGAWTQGKMVLLDNGINFTDFGNQPGGSNPGTRVAYQMSLYQDNPATATNEANLTVRPKGSTSLLSSENQYNEYDALSPVLPFDVVWPMSSNAQHNAEIAFDDYLSNDALVVAHMNAALEVDAQGRWFPDDGFVATRPDVAARYQEDKDRRAGFYFARTPHLQNSSTADGYYAGGAVHPPADILLRGGARVEPVGEGGVLGKGVYLDGQNDFLDVGGIYTTEDDWHHSLWLDSREDSATTRRVVMSFADQSFIEMSRREIVVFDAKAAGPGARQTIDISRLGLRKGQYYHLGFTTTTEGAQRVVRFTVNGTRLGNGELRFPLSSWAVCDRGFALHLPSWGDWGWYVVGGVPHPSHPYAPTGLLPWKGWVDELRTYRVTPQQAAGSYFDEIACNFALGTLVKVHDDQGDATDPDLGPLYATAWGHGLVAKAPWEYPVPPATASAYKMAMFGPGGSPDTCPQDETCDPAAPYVPRCAPDEPCDLGDVDPSAPSPDGTCAPGEACDLIRMELLGTNQASFDPTLDPVLDPAPDPGMSPALDPAPDPGLEPTFGDPTAGDPPAGDPSSGALGSAAGTVKDVSVAADPGTPEYLGRSVYVCEQMKLVSYTQPLDFPAQGHSRVCIDRVHRSANPSAALAARCMRRSVLGIAGLPLSHSVPRPDFSSVQFCNSCHSTGAHIDGLRSVALAAGTVPRQQDRRRQPLDVPAVLSGWTPTTNGTTPQGPLAFPGLPNAGLPLDQFFDHQPKIMP
jgi:hypothetical protein